MADICDIADAAIEQSMNALLASRVRPPTAPYRGECKECEGPIESARAAAGYCTCIECATLLEQRSRHLRKAH